MIKKLTMAAILVGMLSTPTLANSKMSDDVCPSCHKTSCDCEKSMEQDIYAPVESLDETPCDNSDKDKKKEKKNKLSFKQIYSYPMAVFGADNYIGQKNNSIKASQHKPDTPSTILSNNINGVTVLPSNNMTGAAAQVLSVDHKTKELYASGFDDDNMIKSSNKMINIETPSSMQMYKKVLKEVGVPTGGAAAIYNDMLSSIFPDVPKSYWAACDIDKLAINNVVVGYPDKKFKPNLPVTRAEFASMLVKGFNMNEDGLQRSNTFVDVPESHWANPVITKAFEENLLKGYPDSKFKPQSHITRAEALTVIAKGINSDLSEEEASEVLNKYKDGSSVPDWARISVAKALKCDALKDFMNPKTIKPHKEASRADVASMLQMIRITNNYDKNPITARNDCRCLEKKAYVEEMEKITVPTLKLEFLDQINAKSSNVGEQVSATTLENIKINGQEYMSGSTVRGKIVEVIRPSGSEKGALKLVFTQIQSEDGMFRAELPQQILTAQIDDKKQANLFVKSVEWPFTWIGGLLGNVGRTVGGGISNIGNAAEEMTNIFGIATGELLSGQFKASGRSYQDFAKSVVKAPVNATMTALAGTAGLFQSTGEEVAFLVNSNGNNVSALNPKEKISIAFNQIEK